MCMRNGLKRIKVNEAGEYIEFSAASADFFKAFYDLVVWINRIEQDVVKLEGQQEKAFSRPGGNTGAEEMEMVLDRRRKILTEACGKVDGIFGAEASRKIFGGRLPSFEEMADFFEQITPYVRKSAEEGWAAKGKHSRSRKRRR